MTTRIRRLATIGVAALGTLAVFVAAHGATLAEAARLYPVSP